MNDHNLPKIASLIGIVAAGIIILLVPIEPMISRIGREIWDFSHFIFFTLISLFVLRSLIKHKSKAHHNYYLKVFIALICIAIAAEGIQFFSPSRNASMIDVIRNILGVIAGFVWRLPKSKAILSSVLATFLALLPALPVIIDEIQMRNQFPVLIDAISPNYYPFQHNRLLGVKNAKCRSIEVEEKCGFIHSIEDKQYSGVSLISVIPDWTGYNSLMLTIWSDTTGQVTLRVHDYQHLDNYSYNDRFNQSVKLSKGINTIIIPLDEIENEPNSRKMNMREIHQLLMFSSRPHSISTFNIKRIELIN